MFEQMYRGAKYQLYAYTRMYCIYKTLNNWKLLHIWNFYIFSHNNNTIIINVPCTQPISRLQEGKNVKTIAACHEGNKGFWKVTRDFEKIS